MLPDLRRPLPEVAATVRLDRSFDVVGGVRLEARAAATGVRLRWTGTAEPGFDRWVLWRSHGFDAVVVATIRSPAPGRLVDPEGVAGRHSYLLVARDAGGRVLASSHVALP